MTKLHLTNDLLKKFFLFNDLNEEELNKILSFSHLKKYDKNEIIFFESEPYNGFYGVTEGAVKLFKISSEGREHIVHIFYPYSTFGEIPVFEDFNSVKHDEAKYPINAMAIEDNTYVVLISAKPFLDFVENNNGISLKLLSTLSKRLKVLNTHIEGLTLLDVKKRLAKYIIEEFEKVITKKSGKINDLELHISKYDLASHLGTINETLSRTFKKLQEEDIIGVQGKKIKIKNLSKLKKAAS